MAIIIGFCLAALILASALLRMILLWAGLAGVAVVALFVYLAIDHSQSQPKPVLEGTAANYRQAQDAVAKARGKPCDYACKVMIASGGNPFPDTPAP